VPDLREDVQSLTMNAAPPVFASVLVSCEHAGNAVPLEWADRFRGHDELLESHRGWDPGSAGVAERLASGLGAPHIACSGTRLLADPNRSRGNPALHGLPMRGASPAELERALEAAWAPHRAAVTRALDGAATPTLHLSMHSFTPVLDGVERETAVGLLYDPARSAERAVCRSWARRLRDVLSVPVHLNRPYRGTSDGLTATLRNRYPDLGYAGIEIEVRNDLLLRDGPERWAEILLESLRGTGAVGGSPGSSS